MKKIIIYTDGACSGNPGIGGWGAVLICGSHTKEVSGSCELTTNNRMELTAAIEAMKCIKEACDVKLHSDSAYLINCFTQNWITKWKLKNWHNVKNVDLWKQLDALAQFHRVTWIKVIGHSGNKYNEICDRLAVSEIKKFRKILGEDACNPL